MSLSAGSTVGRYEIRALLGTGGMGEVYKAHDPTLGRFVALKLLRDNLSADADRITRFLQEARAASALNHPNILTIHEVGDHNQSRFIVSEFVEGETLRARMERGALSLREILDVAIQTASALAAAHAAGIVHRDIKPENLMLRPDGYVKVLDFGVAKLAPATDDADPGVTRATANTAVGMVVGTMAYMAPEQARGLHVDGRADSFSLGVVLYELLAGRTPFVGATTSDVLVAILDKEPPPLRSLARGLPLPLEWIIAKALEKDPALRYQSMADFRVDLVRLKSAIESGRLAEIAVADAPAVDVPIDVALTDESPQVRALSAATRWSFAAAALAAAAFIAAFALHPQSRIGAELPLQMPEGAVLTKARDALQSLGYSDWGPRTAVEFEPALNVSHVASLSGLETAREAVRAAVVAEWAVGFSHTRAASQLLSDETTPQEGEFAVGLDPTGKLVRFATGASRQAASIPDRDVAIRTGLDIVRRIYGIDASGYELEFVQRAFPTGTVEMTWRNPSPRFNHVEQLRVHLQGDRIVRLARSYEPPPGFSEPALSTLSIIAKSVSPVAILLAFVAALGFGLYVLFKTKNWDAMKQPLPLAMCAILIVGFGVMLVDAPDWRIVAGLVVMAVLVISTGIPAVSGLLLWIRRRTPTRLWAADQLMRGRWRDPAIAASIVSGVFGGAAVVSVGVLGDFLTLRHEGYLPSISSEITAADQNVALLVFPALFGATILVLALSLAVEALDWMRIRPLWSTALIAVTVALIGVGEHGTAIVALERAGLNALNIAIVVALYRARGLVSAWVAFFVGGLLGDALAARSLDEPDRVWLSNLGFAIVIVVLALGLWGVTKHYLATRTVTPLSART